MEEVFGKLVDEDSNFGQMVLGEDMKQQQWKEVAGSEKFIYNANAWCAGVDDQELTIYALSNLGLVVILMRVLSAELMHGMAMRLSWDPGGRVV